MSFIDDVRNANPDVDGTEAAWIVLEHALDAADARLMLEALDLERVEWRWNQGRCGWLALVKGRHGQVLNANVLRAALPDGVAWRIPGTLKAMVAVGLAEPTGQVVRAAHKAAKGRPVRCYRLTPAGEALASETSAAAGEPYLVALNTMEVRPPKVA